VSDEETRDKGEEEDVEAHKVTLGKNTLGADEEPEEEGADVEAHKYTLGRTTLGASDEDDEEANRV
jgi:hypothetical protein